jgi:plastocyanin
MRTALLPAVVGIPLIALAALFLALSGQARAEETVTVEMGDNWMCDPSFANAVCETIVNAGDTVVWLNVGALPHTATAAEFDSGIVGTGESFSFTFTTPGTFDYDCVIHPGEMPGRIVVQAAAEETPTPAPAEPAPTPVPGEPTPVPVEGESEPTPAPTPAAIPATGGASSSAAGVQWAAVLGLAGGIALLLASAGLAVRTLRDR